MQLTYKFYLLSSPIPEQRRNFQVTPYARRPRSCRNCPGTRWAKSRRRSLSRSCFPDSSFFLDVNKLFVFYYKAYLLGECCILNSFLFTTRKMNLMSRDTFSPRQLLLRASQRLLLYHVFWSGKYLTVACSATVKTRHPRGELVLNMH